MLECLATQDYVSKILLLNRIILISEEITTQTATATCALLLVLESEDKERDVSLYINSSGGEVSAGLAIYDTMQLIKPDVATVCIGQATSIASLILVGGARGKRYCTPNSTIMLHQLSGGVSGQASDIELHAINILNLKELTTNIYVKHCNRPREEIVTALERGRFMCAKAALELGMIDSIICSTPRI